MTGIVGGFMTLCGAGGPAPPMGGRGNPIDGKATGAGAAGESDAPPAFRSLAPLIKLAILGGPPADAPADGLPPPGALATAVLHTVK